MGLNNYCFDGSRVLDLESLSTDGKEDKAVKEEILDKTAKNQKEIAVLQDMLYADGREGMIILLQAMDAAGKDSTIKHVMSGINPQGVEVHSFKTPNSEELAHDFLWRINKCIPQRGKIAIFNRSYYEDVLFVQVHELNKNYHMADRLTGMDTSLFFENRYEQIKNYEEYLYENSYRIVKIFLNVSRQEQKKRFLERIDKPEKNWKFSASDLAERALWDKYHKVYQNVINVTATKENPWYVLPADRKWYTRYLVSEAVLKALRDIDPQYPVMPASEKERLDGYRDALVNEL